MHVTVYDLTVTTIVAPLLGAIIAGLFGHQLGTKWSHRVTILGMFVSFIAACFIGNHMLIDGLPAVNQTLYTWGISGGITFHLGILIDNLTSAMMLVVTFVSLLVHIYSIGYMAGDSGYQRFFAYISFFTFAMLMLVTANNFLQLFFGWEGVGLASYLLIGFWFHRESAIVGSFKAFLVNRVGDFGFILGIAVVFVTFGTLDYLPIFAKVAQVAHHAPMITIFGHVKWPEITVICVLLFIGAMGKSAQIPLHVWLPESMEGPTPISALIHAATMVTAGVFMVSRMSPLFEHSDAARSMVMILGATGALFLGLVAIVQNDIKRIVAYSTLSQLGYMMAAVGASAYAAGIFHLFTHACFKALLFLGAGSVIIAMHHEQDIRNMGNLRKYLPITYITFLIGSLSLAAIPPFSGFYSKDAIIEAVRDTMTPGAHYAYICVLLGAFVTALYTFRALFAVFHGEERVPEKLKAHLHEPSWTVWLPLVILAVPSAVLGFMTVKPILYAHKTLFHSDILVLPSHNVMAKLASHYTGPWHAVLAAFSSAPFWLAMAGIFTAWLCYIKMPSLPTMLSDRFTIIYKILCNKFGFDSLNDLIFVRGGQRFAHFCYEVTDQKLIDGFVINGSSNSVRRISQVVRKMQSGYLYHYALVMILGLMGLLLWLM